MRRAGGRRLARNRETITVETIRVQGRACGAKIGLSTRGCKHLSRKVEELKSLKVKARARPRFVLRNGRNHKVGNSLAYGFHRCGSRSRRLCVCGFAQELVQDFGDLENGAIFEGGYGLTELCEGGRI